MNREKMSLQSFLPIISSPLRSFIQIAHPLPAASQIHSFLGMEMFQERARELPNKE